MFFRIHAFQSPGFLESRFFRVQVFLSPGFSGSRFFRVRIQGSGLGFRSSPSKPIKICSPLKISQSITLNGAHVMEITKACTVTFMKARKYLAL